MLISNNKNFILYFEGEVFFQNYRNSNLSKWEYLLIKRGNMISIENKNSVSPIFSEKDVIVLSRTWNNLKFYKKWEDKIIELHIYKEILLFEKLDNWSKNKLGKIQERNIRDELFQNLNEIEDWLNPIKMEYETEYWNIDILAEKNWYYYIIELKKKQTSLEAVNQVLRYRDFFEWKNIKTVSFVIWKGISKKAEKFAEDNHVKLLDLNNLSFFNTIY